jgi:hypothetical protein
VSRNWTRRRAVKAGYRSGFEQTVIEYVRDVLDLPYEYETEKLTYVVPESKHVYTPDLLFKKKDGGTMYIELKGRLDAETRKKMVNVKLSNPTLDIRFMFQNPNVKINKTSRTSYADWAEKNGFPWCGPTLKTCWISEISLDVRENP